MEPGYLLALCLTCAGLFGILFALWRLRAERRERATDLARFLRSGQIPETGLRAVLPPPVSRPAKPVPTRPSTVQSSAALLRSDARQALRSAYAAAR